MEEPETLGGPSCQHIEAEAEDDGQHGQDRPVPDDERDLRVGGESGQGTARSPAHGSVEVGRSTPRLHEWHLLRPPGMVAERGHLGGSCSRTPGDSVAALPTSMVMDSRPDMATTTAKD